MSKLSTSESCFLLNAMGRFSSEIFQDVDSKILEKPMEWFLIRKYQSLDLKILKGPFPENLSAFLALESIVLPYQYPSLDPDILDLKSGKEHQWIDFQQ